MNVLVAFAITFAVLLVSLIKFKVSPAVGLFLSAVVMGFLTGMPVPDILSNISSGFGSTMASIGLVILFGGIFGEMLGDSNATEEMAKWLLRKIGRKNDLLAINLAGFIVSIPVYFASGYIMLSSLVTSLHKFTGKAIRSYAAALFVGLLLTHCIVAPTPGPVAVASQIGANLGWFILYGLIVALPATLLCGWQYGNLIARGGESDDPKELEAEAAAIAADEEKLLRADPAKPSHLTALALIVFPILLIVLGAVMPHLLPKDNPSLVVFTFLGNNNMALFLAMMITALALRKHLVPRVKPGIMKYIDASSDRLGNILMVIGTGGCFGMVLQKSGLGDALVQLLSSWNLPVILLAYLLAMIIRAAVGSATVAMLTTVSIVAPAVTAMQLSPVTTGLAICAGSVGLTVPTDAAFWLPAKYNNLTMNDALVSTTYSTTLASAVAFAMVLLLHALSGVLPGMY